MQMKIIKKGQTQKVLKRHCSTCFSHYANWIEAVTQGLAVPVPPESAGPETAVPRTQGLTGQRTQKGFVFPWTRMFAAFTKKGLF
jgi:hypothetical protein